MDNDREQKIKDFLHSPERTIYEQIEEFKKSIAELVTAIKEAGLSGLSHIQGKNGDDGVTPVRGIDYMTETDIDAMEQFMLDRLPEEGIDYPTFKEIKDYIHAQVARIPAIKGAPGIKGDKGVPGNDGSPDTAKQILEKLRSLPKNQGLQMKDVRGLDNRFKSVNDLVDELEERINDQRFVVSTGIGGDGGGSGGGSGTPYTLPTASTTVLGGVKVDGSSIVINGNGVISSTTGGAGSVTNVSSTTADLTITSSTTTPEITVVSAPKLTTSRKIAGVLFNGTIDISLNNNAITNGANYITNSALSGYATLTGTQTLTNKTLTSPKISSISNSGTLTLPTTTGTLALVSQITGTNSGTNTGDQNLSAYALTSAIPTNNNSLINGAGYITSAGNAASATVLQTSRTINGVSFDGSANITVTANAATLSGTNLRSTVTSSALTSVGTISTGVWKGTVIADAYIASAATWNAKQDAITLTTTGTSGVATFSANTLNIPNYDTSSLSPFGDGSDGDATISTNTTLASDKYYNNLTINSGIVLETGGYHIFVKGTLTNNGVISNNGGAGGDGGVGGVDSGTAGVKAAEGTVSGGTAGVEGGGYYHGGLPGLAGNPSITNVNGVSGGDGRGGAGGAAGVATPETLHFGVTSKSSLNGYVFNNENTDFSLEYLYGQISGALLSSSAGSGSGSGNAGGGSGATGGVVYVAGAIITGTGSIQAKGGAGGVGAGGPGGGGGGGGGSGGFVALIYNSFSGVSIDVGGGAGGAGGGSGATKGSNGNNGNTGKYIKIKV